MGEIPEDVTKELQVKFFNYLNYESLWLSNKDFLARDRDFMWTEQHSCGVVIASAGYPENYISNKDVQIYPENDQDMKLFHAGTKLVDGNVVTSGGRVFCATALGSDLKEAQSKAYNLVNKVSFEGAFCRKDIGFKGIK